MRIFKKIVVISSVALMFLSLNSKSQILFNMGDYRNLTYASTGYNNGYQNITLGIARRGYSKILKRELVGILDGSFALTNNYFTKNTLRKGFQTDIYKKDNFRIPMILATSSIVREDAFYKFHDFTLEMNLNPGIYKQKYTLALDFKYEFIAFRYERYRTDYLKTQNPHAKNHWDNPDISIFKVGFIGGLNFKHCILYIRSGYESNAVNSYRGLPAYALLGFGYKFESKPFN